MLKLKNTLQFLKSKYMNLKIYRQSDDSQISKDLKILSVTLRLLPGRSSNIIPMIFRWEWLVFNLKCSIWKTQRNKCLKTTTATVCIHEEPISIFKSHRLKFARPKTESGFFHLSLITNVFQFFVKHNGYFNVFIKLVFMRKNCVDIL